MSDRIFVLSDQNGHLVEHMPFQEKKVTMVVLQELFSINQSDIEQRAVLVLHTHVRIFKCIQTLVRKGFLILSFILNTMSLQAHGPFDQQPCCFDFASIKITTTFHRSLMRWSLICL